MTNDRKIALEMLRSRNFFDRLRGTMTRIGLAGEERFGIGLFFVMVSRFRPNPLRVYIQQVTRGSSTYLVQRVAELMPSNHRAGIFRGLDEAWQNLEKFPNNKVVYLPPHRESEGWRGKFRFDFSENCLTSTWPVNRDGRVVEKTRTVDGRFVLLSAEPPPEWKNLTRWLTLRLHKPPEEVQDEMPLGDADLAEWHKVQELIAERSQLPILLPDWEELVIEWICRDERSRRHVPAFLIAWKTMCVLRSFLSDGQLAKPDIIKADFESFAATAALVKKAFPEGCWFPSAAQIYDAISIPGSRAALVSPVTGKALTYAKEAKREPVRWHRLLK